MAHVSALITPLFYRIPCCSVIVFESKGSVLKFLKISLFNLSAVGFFVKVVVAD